jgi:mRNA interferase MazF
VTVAPQPWEIWRVAFEPAHNATGREQDERPAIVVGTRYHCRLPNRLALVVPLTSKDRGLIWQPRLSIGTRTRPSIALVEQLRAVSYGRLRHRERQKLTGADIDSVKFVLRQMVDVG